LARSFALIICRDRFAASVLTRSKVLVLNTKKKAVYPGSFDPVTNGHIEIIRRACKLFDEVVVGVGVNPKKPSLFDLEERVEMLSACCGGFSNLKIMAFESLAVELVKQLNAEVIIRGLRSESDFAFEMNMALMNQHLAPETETIFLPAGVQNLAVSSSLIKEIASYGRDVSALVPELVAKKLADKFC